jgi:hypothetical protein
MLNNVSKYGCRLFTTFEFYNNQCKISPISPAHAFFLKSGFTSLHIAGLGLLPVVTHLMCSADAIWRSRAEIEIKPLTHLASAMISSAGSSTHAPHPPHSLHKNFLSVLPLKEVLHLPTRDAHRVAFSQFSQSTLRLAANPELSITYDKHCHQQF